MCAGLLIAFLGGMITMATVLILDHRLTKWVEDHPRPINSVCEYAEPIMISSDVIGNNYTKEIPSIHTRCYPTHVGRSINVWHSLQGTGGEVRVSYEISENPTDYPVALGGSTKTAKPKRIWIYTGKCDYATAALKAVDSQENNVTFASVDNEKYYLSVTGYSFVDAYSTQEFCINVEYVH